MTELSTIIMFIIVRDDTNTCDLTAGCVGRMIGPPWTGLTPDSNPSLKDECPLFSYLPKWFALLLHLQHQIALPSESSVSGQASSELLKWSQVLLFQSNLTLTWHIQGFLHLFFKLCQLLFGSLIALGTHLTSLKRNVNCNIGVGKFFTCRERLPHLRLGCSSRSRRSQQLCWRLDLKIYVDGCR